MILVLCIVVTLFVIINASFNLYFQNRDHEELMEMLLDIKNEIECLRFPHISTQSNNEPKAVNNFKKILEKFLYEEEEK